MLKQEQTKISWAQACLKKSMPEVSSMGLQGAQMVICLLVLIDQRLLLQIPMRLMQQIQSQRIFNPNNAFLRNRMRMYQDQGGGILPPTTGTQPTSSAPPPPQMPMLPTPNMPRQLRGIMGLADRSNMSVLPCVTLRKTTTG